MAEKRIYRSDTLGKEFEASGAAYKDLRNEIGEAWRPLQEEAYALYCAWEAEMDAEEEIAARELDI